MEDRFVKRFKRQLSDKDRIRRYYILLLALNDIKVSRQELDTLVLIMFSNKPIGHLERKEVVASLNSTAGTIDNTISSLKKKGLLIEENGKTLINPFCAMPVNKDVTLEIQLNGEAIHEGN